MKKIIIIATVLVSLLNSFAGMPFIGGSADLLLKNYDQSNNWLTNGDRVDFNWRGRLPTLDSNNLQIMVVAGGSTNVVWETGLYTSQRWQLLANATRDQDTNLIWEITFSSQDTNDIGNFYGVVSITNTLPAATIELHASNTNSILTFDGFASPTDYLPPTPLSLFLNYIATNSGGGVGVGGGITNFSFTATNLAPGSAATVTNTGVIGSIAYVTIGIPVGAPGTNFVTTSVFSNGVYSSSLFTLTNLPVLTFNGSNYIGRFSQLYSWKLATPSLGGGGLAPPTNQFEQLVGSYTGTNAWFSITNGFTTFTNISISVVGASSTNVGALTLYGLDHPEYIGRTNSFIGQHAAFDDPVHLTDAATKKYVDVATAALASLWASGFDTNAATHYSYSQLSAPLVDLVTSNAFVKIEGFADDGTQLAANLTVMQTNLINGWQVESSTNLISTTSWGKFTTYTASTNSGLVTFNIAYDFTLASRFFRVRGSSARSASFYAPITAFGGTYYPSNTWSLFAITNNMANRSFWIGPSNDVPVMVRMSNGVPVVKFL
jgi:hypothetical protein